MKRSLMAALTMAAIVFAAGCGGDTADASPASGTANETAEAAAPERTGTVIEVAMITDDEGNYFEPSTIEARPGDLIRFVLESGVHNVSFPGESNPGVSDLPEASPYLQLPGQTFDLLVDLEPGEYAFQCDPHALLGMVGTLTVKN